MKKQELSRKTNWEKHSKTNPNIYIENKKIKINFQHLKVFLNILTNYQIYAFLIMQNLSSQLHNKYDKLSKTFQIF